MFLEYICEYGIPQQCKKDITNIFVNISQRISPYILFFPKITAVTNIDLLFLSSPLSTFFAWISHLHAMNGKPPHGDPWGCIRARHISFPSLESYAVGFPISKTFFISDMFFSFLFFENWDEKFGTTYSNKNILVLQHVKVYICLSSSFWKSVTL